MRRLRRSWNGATVQVGLQRLAGAGKGSEKVGGEEPVHSGASESDNTPASAAVRVKAARVSCSAARAPSGRGWVGEMSLLL